MLEELAAALDGHRVSAEYAQRVTAAREDWERAYREIVHPARDGGRMHASEVIRVLNEELGPEATIVHAAGGLPGDLHKLWKSKAPGDYHSEYGYSCMGYEIAGALGVKMARPERDVYALVGDGSYLMLSQEIVTSVQEGRKITLVLFDNHGYDCIHNLQKRLRRRRVRQRVPRARRAQRPPRRRGGAGGLRGQRPQPGRGHLLRGERGRPAPRAATGAGGGAHDAWCTFRSSRTRRCPATRGGTCRSPRPRARRPSARRAPATRKRSPNAVSTTEARIPLTTTIAGRRAFAAEDALPLSTFREITDVRVEHPKWIQKEARQRKRRGKLTRDGKLVLLALDHPGRGVNQIRGDALAMGDRHQLLARARRVFDDPDLDGVMGTADILEELLILSHLERRASGKGFLDGRVLVGSMNRGGLAGRRPSRWRTRSPPTPRRGWRSCARRAGR